MAREWTTDLAVGVSEIDNQHKELFRIANQLLAAMSKGDGGKEVASVLDFLARYALSHFATEERYMARHAYPSLEAHRMQHEAFVRNFTQWKDQYRKQGATTMLVLDIQRRVGEWLVNHICKTDKALGSFLKAANGTPAWV